MPNIAAPLAPTNAAAQAIGCGIPAPSIVFQPGGTTGGNIYATEALLAQIIQPSFGMNGQFPVYLDFTANSDAYTASANMSFGPHAVLTGIVNQTSGAVPALTTAHTLVAPAEIRDVHLACTLAGTVFTANPKWLRLSGKTTLTCASGTTLYTVASSGFALYLDGASTLGDGTHTVLTVGASGGLTINVAAGATLAAAAFSITSGGAVTINAAPGATVASSYIGMTGVTIVGGGGGGGGGAGPVLDVYPTNLTTLETGLATVAAESFGVSRFYCNFGHVTLPSGSYSIGAISEWTGDPTASALPEITFAAGATWSQFPTRMEAVYFLSPPTPTGAVWSAQDITCELVNAFVSSANTISHPLIDVSNHALVFDLRGVSQVSGTAGVGTSGVIDMVTLGAGYSVVINLYDASIVGPLAFGAQLLAYAAANPGSLVINKYSRGATVTDPLLYAYVVDASVSNAELDVLVTSQAAMLKGFAQLTAGAYDYSTFRFASSLAGGSVTLPSGAYNWLRNSQFVGLSPFANDTLVVAAGATLAFLPRVLKNCSFVVNATTGTVFNGFVQCDLFDASIQAAAALAHPFIELATNAVTLNLYGSSNLNGNGGTSGLIDKLVSGGGSIVINLYDSSSISGSHTFGAALLAYAAANPGNVVIYKHGALVQVDDTTLVPYVVDLVTPLTTIIFQPGGTDPSFYPSANVATNEAEFNALRAQLPPTTPVTVYYDDQANGDYVTVGTLHFGPNDTFIGLFNESNQAYPTLEVAVAIDPPYEIRDITVDAQVSPFLTSVPTALVLSGSTLLSGGSPAFTVPAGELMTLYLRDTANSTAGILVQNTAGGAGMNVFMGPLTALSGVTAATPAALNIVAAAKWGSLIYGVQSPQRLQTGCHVVNVDDPGPSEVQAPSAGAHTLLTPPNNEFRVSTTVRSFIGVLPPVAGLPNGWKVVTWLTAGTNLMAVQVDGTNSEKLQNPSTGAGGLTSWDTSVVGSKPGVRITWEWSALLNEWISY